MYRIFRCCYFFISLVVFTWAMTACRKHDTVTLLGYIDAKYTYISSSHNGILQAIYVTEGDYVKQGQRLFTLEPLPESAELQAANAREQAALSDVNKAKAVFNLNKQDFQRREYLFRKEVISKEEFDTAKSNFMQSQATLTATEDNYDVRQAELNKAKWATQQKYVTSPIPSLVFDVYYNRGEFVPSAKPVLALLAPQQVKVVFFAPEMILSEIKLNQYIEVNCDNCQHPIKAKISYISNKAEYTPPVIYSLEERTKLVYRIEAIPEVPNVLASLHTGQTVSIQFEIHS